jgi:hypothetical protein
MNDLIKNKFVIKLIALFCVLIIFMSLAGYLSAVLFFYLFTALSTLFSVIIFINFNSTYIIPDDKLKPYNILAKIFFLIFIIVSSFLFLRFYSLLIANKIPILKPLNFFNSVFVVFSIIVSGTILYMIRQNIRVWYGVIESIVGIITAYIAFYQANNPQNIDFAIKISAGLYIIVRGLDNIEKSFTKKANYIGNIWTNFFKWFAG